MRWCAGASLTSSRRIYEFAAGGRRLPRVLKFSTGTERDWDVAQAQQPVSSCQVGRTLSVENSLITFAHRLKMRRDSFHLTETLSTLQGETILEPSRLGETPQKRVSADGPPEEGSGLPPLAREQEDALCVLPAASPVQCRFATTGVTGLAGGSMFALIAVNGPAELPLS